MKCAEPLSRFSPVLVGLLLLCLPAAAADNLNEQSVSRADISALDAQTAFRNPSFVCGDADGNQIVNVSDPVFLTAYFFQGEAAPDPWQTGDADGCGNLNVADIAYLLKYIFAGGPEPCPETPICELTNGGNEVTLGCPVEAEVAGPVTVVSIPVYASNAAAVSAFSLGFHYDSDDVEITGVSNAGSVLPGSAYLVSGTLPADNQIIVGWTDWTAANPLAPQSGGLLFSLEMEVPGNITPQTIDISSVFVAPAGEFIFALDAGGWVTPDYVDCGAEDVIITVGELVCGDADHNGIVNVSDAVYVMTYLFDDGAAPDPWTAGDADGCGEVNVADVAFLLKYVFAGGPAPCPETPICDLLTGGNKVSLDCPIQITSPEVTTIVSIPVYGTNVQDVSALSLGFSHNSPDVEITGVSTAGTVLSDPVYMVYTLRPDDNEALVGWVDWTAVNPLTPQSGGLLFTLEMEVPAGTDPQTIDIATSFVDPGGEFIFAYASGGQVVPEYVDCGTADVIITGEDCICGDVDCDGVINISDVVYIVNYLLGTGPAPVDPVAADADGCGEISLGDAIYIVQYGFMDGPPPCPETPICEQPVGGNRVDVGCPVTMDVPTETTVIDVPIYATNEDDVAGFSLGFHYDSDDVEIVGVSSVGSIIPNPAWATIKLVPDDNEALVVWADYSVFNPISPQTGGLLFTLEVEIPGGITPQTIDLNSTFVDPGGRFALYRFAGGWVTPGYYDCGTVDIEIVADYISGDADANQLVNISDAVYILSYIFGAGDEPQPYDAGDADGNELVNISDAVYLIAYIFGSGPAPR